MIGATLRRRLKEGERLLMVNPNHVSSGLVARLAELGADAIFIDCEHGTAGFDDVREMARAARSAGGGAIVRPDSHQRSLITRYLNCGADGVMVPLVNNAGEASAIVNVVRHACPQDYVDRLVVAMIETTEAIGSLDEILAVDGIDVFFIGPSDLSQSMGYPPSVPRGKRRPDEVLDTIRATLARIGKAGKIAGTLVTEEDISEWSVAGAQLLYCHTDNFLRNGLELLRAESTLRLR